MIKNIDFPISLDKELYFDFDGYQNTIFDEMLDLQLDGYMDSFRITNKLNEEIHVDLIVVLDNELTLEINEKY